MKFDDRTRSTPWNPQIDTRRGEPPSEFSVLAEACLYFIYRDRMHISKHLIGRYEYSGITYGLANILWDNRGKNILDPAILEVVASGRSWRELPTAKVRAEVKKMWKAAQSLPRPDFTYIHQELPFVELEEHQRTSIEGHNHSNDHQHGNVEGHNHVEDQHHGKNKNHHHTKTEDHQHA